MVSRLRSLLLPLLMLVTLHVFRADDDAIDCSTNGCFRYPTTLKQGSESAELLRDRSLSMSTNDLKEAYLHGVYINYHPVNTVCPNCWVIMFGYPEGEAGLMLSSFKIGSEQFKVKHDVSQLPVATTKATVKCIYSQQKTTKENEKFRVVAYSISPNGGSNDMNSALGFWTGTRDELSVIFNGVGLPYKATGVADLSHCTKNLKGNAKLTDRTISCEGTQMISYKVEGADAKSTLGELKCHKDGWKDGSNAIANRANIVVDCVEKCASEFATGALKPNNNKLKCTVATEIILVDIGTNKKRIFEEDLTCDVAKGWKTSAETIIDFSKEVKIAASCFDVCTVGVVELCSQGGPDCSGAPSPLLRPTASTDGTRTIKCNDVNYQLFISEKKDDAVMKGCNEQEITCTKYGWFGNDPTPYVDFKSDAVDISQKIEAVCKHKCHPDYIKDSCAEGTVVSGKTTCSKVKYVKDGALWKMSCGHPSEIIVVEQGGIAKESFGDVECSNEGWKDATRQSMFDLKNKKYEIKARCEQICHPDLLEGITINSRAYTLDNQPLTCTKYEEMLKFNDLAVYSDMKCTKDGWKKEKDATLAIKFAANSLTNRRPKAECVQSNCFRQLSKPCATVAAEEKKGCTEPDFAKKKYRVSCQAPYKLLRHQFQVQDSPISYSELFCENENWKTVDQKTDYLPGDGEFDLICSAEVCTRCQDKQPRIECALDTTGNCHPIQFHKGHFRQCSRYVCGSGHHYKIQNGVESEYYLNENIDGKETAIQCSDPATQEFITPDTLKAVMKTSHIGCVRQIPCDEHAPLNLDCSSLKVKCDEEKMKTKLKEGSRRISDSTKSVQCDGEEKMYYTTGGTSWTVIDHLKCNQEGEWDATDSSAKVIELTKLQKAAQKKDRSVAAVRVVCATADPTVLPPGATTPAPDPMTQTCHYCRLPAALKCDECRNIESNVNTSSKNGVCTATSKTGRFVVNDDKYETKSLTCKKDDATGEYVWKDDKGRAVAKVAAREPKLMDKMSLMAIIGIVVGCIALLGIIAGIIVFGYVKRKRDAQKREEALVKGLSQRIDTIIDKVSFEEPATVRL